MFIKDIISQQIKGITPKTTAKKALEILDGYKLTHLIIQENNRLVGMINEACLLTLDDETPIEVKKEQWEKFAVIQDATLLDTFKIFNIFDTNIIPVIDEHEKIHGSILMDDLVSYFSKFTFVSEPGALLLVEVPFSQYSMSQLAQIVERNNSRFYGAIVVEMHENLVRLAVKIGSENLTTIGEALERYDYNILNKFYRDTKEELIDERYSQLMKYLSI